MNDSNSHFACSKELPALQYVTNIHSKNFRHILADGVPIYDVPNEVELYSALGYKKMAASLAAGRAGGPERGKPKAGAAGRGSLVTFLSRNKKVTRPPRRDPALV